MKNLIFTCALILCMGVAFGQSSKKGSMISVHVDDIKLAPGVTMDQYINHFKNTFAPQYEKALGVKTFLAKGVRGENKNKLAMFILFDTVEARDKYFNDDGTIRDNAAATEAKKENRPPVRRIK